MKIVISASGRDLESMLDPRFGRCPYFLVIDTETEECQPVPNPGMMAGGGAGIQAAQEVVRQGAKAVITGQCGPNAYDVLRSAGVKILQAPVEPVRQVLERYRRGELEELTAPGPAHHGMRGWGRR
ncbi:MAG: NifB/NifX family molybdenum-iron cluster-binding protein [Thermacetogeniaceae bacterium]